MRRTVRLLVLLAALLALLPVVLHLTAEPEPTRPVVLPGPDPARRIFDWLRPPGRLVVVHRGTEHRLPGEPRRHLLARLKPDGLHLGWLDSPEDEPEATLDLPLHGILLEAYVDLHLADLAVVEVWAGYTPERGRERLELRLTP